MIAWPEYLRTIYNNHCSLTFSSPIHAACSLCYGNWAVKLRWGLLYDFLKCFSSRCNNSNFFYIHSSFVINKTHEEDGWSMWKVLCGQKMVDCMGKLTVFPMVFPLAEHDIRLHRTLTHSAIVLYDSNEHNIGSWFAPRTLNKSCSLTLQDVSLVKSACMHYYPIVLYTRHYTLSLLHQLL